MRLIVIGGGFAGVKCARELRKIFPKQDCEIVLFSCENHMVFYPLLAEVAAAAVNPKDMAAALRQLLKNVHCRTEEIVDIDFAQNTIIYSGAESLRTQMKYDHLVVASGNTSNVSFIPGMAEHAFTLKSIMDALHIQEHVIGQLEKAELEKNPTKKSLLLKFVVVGGGFSGVELAGELNDFLKRSAQFYSNFTREEIEVVLIHAHDQILPEVGPSLREFARKKMSGRGVKFILNASAAQCTAEGVKLKDDTFINAKTIICTIGSRALPMIAALPIPKEKERIRVNADMSIPGFDNAWAIGDCAAVMNAVDGALSPTTGQFAERQGAQVAKNIERRTKGQGTLPFKHTSLGTLCSIGGKSAVAEMFNFRVSGLPAWFIWRGVYLLKLPSFWQRVKIGFTWAFELFFPPSLTYVATDDANAIVFSNFSSGDYVFRTGEPSRNFYMIESGEIEVIEIVNGAESVIRVLQSGDFFGETSLSQKREHNHSCRAKSDCTIVVMGKNIFGHLSTRYQPFKERLVEAAQRRATP
jgi:NADH dehydrogenase